MPRWGDWQPPDGALLDALPPLRGWDSDAYAALRGAVLRGDSQAVMDLLVDRVPAEAAQLAGDGLLLAVEQRLDGTTGTARELAEDLRGQFDPGAITLADELDAVCGDTSAPALTPVPVELDELSMHLESGDDLGDGHLDLQTGQIWPVDAEQVADDLADWEEPDRWLDVTPVGSREAWQDMREFAGTIEDGERGERLLRAIAGRGAFRAFRLLLDDHPETRDTWRVFAEELAQEALAGALLHWDKVGQARSPGAYVHRLAMNLANSHFRRRRAAARALARHGPADAVHRDPPTADVLAVRQAVQQLPRRQRQIVVLRYRSDLSFPEIAEVLGMTVGAAKALHHRAAGRLRRLLAPESGTDRVLLENGQVTVDAGAPNPSTTQAVPFAPSVELGLGPDLTRQVDIADIADPTAWVFEDAVFRARDGDLSALEPVRQDRVVQVLVGEHPHCASPPMPAPDGYDQHRRVSIQPLDIASCIEWWTVDLFLHDGMVDAVSLDLWEP